MNHFKGNSVYFNISDHQGNIRQVWNATTGQTVQDNHYYPYGAPFGESASTEFVKAMARARQSEISTNQYKYSAKEWQPLQGLNLYDFPARQYDPILCRFISPDPLNFNYPHLSPYLYCAANPINNTDPTGLAVIYNKYGEYLGETIEGFTGGIYIYSGSEKIDFSKLYEYELTLDQIEGLTSYNEGNLSIGAHLSIINHVIAHFNGTYIFDKKFETSKMGGGEIYYYNEPFDNNGETYWATSYENKNGEIINPAYIFWVNVFTNTYEGTIENIASSVLVHEWYSHGIMHNDDKSKSHRLAYKNVINYKPLWDLTTDKYKGFIMHQLQDYTKQETGRTTVDGPYRNLYNKYIKYFNHGK